VEHLCLASTIARSPSLHEPKSNSRAKPQCSRYPRSRIRTEMSRREDLRSTTDCYGELDDRWRWRCRSSVPLPAVKTTTSPSRTRPGGIPMLARALHKLMTARERGVSRVVEAILDTWFVAGLFPLAPRRFDVIFKKGALAYCRWRGFVQARAPNFEAYPCTSRPARRSGRRSRRLSREPRAGCSHTNSGTCGKPHVPRLYKHGREQSQ